MDLCWDGCKQEKLQFQLAFLIIILNEKATIEGEAASPNY
jgi:hypothetical protein